MQSLRNREEPQVSLDHVPMGVQADVAHQRDQGGEELRHTTAVCGGVHVEDSLALQGLGGIPKSIQVFLADYASIVI